MAWALDVVLGGIAALLLIVGFALGWGIIILAALIAIIVGVIVLAVLEAWQTASEGLEKGLGAQWHGEDAIFSMINQVKTDGSPMEKLGAEMADTELYLFDALNC